ncbi:hypothetical protein [Cutibacterium granulosum]|uniref:hypothetical protein n=1 Tax=Cutibacterium granulosum TaxID=33011 RepID=UPI002B23B9CB|nr:hypothetical protein [Cutibacterium granulosum]MEA5639213.1 hypothetical protein [Cutibacterium granulosum]
MNPLVEKLLRVREPLAWVLTALGTGFTVIFLVDFCGALIQGEDTVFELARRSSGGSLGLTIMLAMVAVVWWCRLQDPVVTRSTVIARVAAIVVAVGAGCDLVLAILACVHAPGRTLSVVLGFFGSALVVAVKVLAIIALIVAASPLSHGEQGGADTRPDSVTSGPQRDDPAGSGEEQEQQEQQEHSAPVWTVDEAAGASWTKASDAADGAQASTWGTSGQALDWPQHRNQDSQGQHDDSRQP